MINNLLFHLRNKFFWSIDYLTGKDIKKAYNEIKKIDNLSSDHSFVNKYIGYKKNDIVSHAINTTAFYKSFQENDGLEKFPIINKDIIKENEDAFLSKSYDKENLYTMSTSGSTGTPFTSYQDKSKKRRVNAEVIYYSNKAGYKVGKNLIYLRALTTKNKKNKIKLWLQNETLIDISDLKDKSIKKILKDIVKSSKSGSMLLGYSSTFDSFKDYFERNGIDEVKEANISGVVGSSEMFFDDSRKVMEKAFQSKAVSRYANQENGIIGQDTISNNAFIVNQANYIVEIFDTKSDELLPHGEIGRIVVTDLFNKAMPLIRYDTGDIGSLDTINYQGQNKLIINNFGGRKLDVVYDTAGERLSPHSISNNLWDFPEVQQYQFIQKSKAEYQIKLKVDKEFNDIKKIRTFLHNLLGKEADINIELVNDIPLSASGKRRYILNEMN